MDRTATEAPEAPPESAAPAPRRRRSRRRRAVLALTGLVLGVGTAVMAHRVGDVLQGPPVDGLLPAATDGALPGASDPRLAEIAALLTGTDLEAGHEVEVVVDSTAFRRMEDDLRAARSSITVLTYFCDPGTLAGRWADILVERARAGIRVMVVGDDFGCGDLLDAWLEPLGSAGVQIARLRPLRWYSLHRGQHRNHARSLVVDGRVAWTGGFGLSDLWIGTDGEPAWRETNVRFRGPAVARLQAVFATAWAEATGSLPAGTAIFPEARGPEPGPQDRADGEALAGILTSAPGVGTRAAERYLAVSIASAQRTLYITNSYFVPPDGVRVLLVEAAARGVDVRVLVAGSRTDVRSALWAARGIYDELLRAGVRIWEYAPAMMHAKTMIVDGTWGLVGSLNLDNRSMRLNNEAGLVVHDGRVGATLDSLFLADLERAEERTLAGQRARPLYQRIRDRLVWLIGPLL